MQLKQWAQTEEWQAALNKNMLLCTRIISNNNTNSVALVRERTITTESPPLVGEVSANFCL
jgi:hypothetical protein